MPRPKLNPTDEQRRLAKQLSAVGTPQEQIALMLGIRSPKTLRKHFRNELDLGAIEANASVGGALYKSAMAGNVEAQKFWMLYKGGWGRRTNHTGPAAPPPFIVAQDQCAHDQVDQDQGAQDQVDQDQVDQDEREAA